MNAKDESKLYERQLEVRSWVFVPKRLSTTLRVQNLERIFPQLMKTLEPRDIVPILRARGFLTSTEWTQINSMVRALFDAFIPFQFKHFSHC